MLLDKPFIKGIPYTLVDDIKDTLADLEGALSGCKYYVENQFPPKIVLKKYWMKHLKTSQIQPIKVLSFEIY